MPNASDTDGEGSAGWGIGGMALQAAAVLGGISSKTGRGKHANGAATQSYSRLFNDRTQANCLGWICESYEPATLKVSISTGGNGGHRYALTTDVCSISTCNPDDVYKYVNENSVPFTDDFHNGHHDLFGVIGSNPITHASNTGQRLSVNVTKRGHIFYPEIVSHSVEVRNGRVIVQTLGTGTASNDYYAQFNNFVGVEGFRSLHRGLKRNF